MQEGLFRTAIYETEDGSEKTASSYLVGIAMALATSRATREADALLHFDGVHGASGTRPDLVVAGHADTHFVEVKGRFMMVGQPAMDSAVRQLASHRLKDQTMYAAAVASGFRGGRLQVHRQWYRPVKPAVGAVLAFLSDESGGWGFRQWEPLALAVWHAAAPAAADRVGRTRIKGTWYVHVELVELGLLVGMAAPTFDRVSDLLRQDDLLSYEIVADPREADVVPLERLEDRYVSDELLIAWTSELEGMN